MTALPCCTIVFIVIEEKHHKSDVFQRKTRKSCPPAPHACSNVFIVTARQIPLQSVQVYLQCTPPCFTAT
jgi:hypothetical protein